MNSGGGWHHSPMIFIAYIIHDGTLLRKAHHATQGSYGDLVNRQTVKLKLEPFL